ncbi:hypothetical protein V495_07467 [Pseudogymnoascus sp. VKM F-4514 (FW-929)]|nr:hypothetical protein V495_07467 [Pseudogymnoascus sp. VKM F-4514 (FW-929)]KFY60152.1 hypothetical protein V497_03839 [Pseudogymnoascus sp. VKM F-4516 (FW-969)]
MSDGFSTLVPAFTLKANLKGYPGTGATSRHPGGISVVEITSGTLISEPSYPIKLNSTFVNGSDYIKPDTSGAFLRLDVKSLLKDESGALITLYYTGHVETTEAIGKALSGAPDAKTVEFGNISTHVTFETDSQELRLLEQKIYVGNGRFIVEDGKLIVEYKISQVQA